MRRSFNLTAFALGAALSPLAGCTSVIKQAYYEARGAQADVLPIDDASSAAIANCLSIEFEPATTGIGPKITPAAMLRAYDVAVTGEAVELRKDAFPGGEPTLRIRTEVLYVQTKGLMSGALALARVRMSSAGGSNLEVLVKAESKSFRAGDEGNLAEAAAKALAKYLRDARGTVKPE